MNAPPWLPLPAKLLQRRDDVVGAERVKIDHLLVVARHLQRRLQRWDGGASGFQRGLRIGEQGHPIGAVGERLLVPVHCIEPCRGVRAPAQRVVRHALEQQSREFNKQAAVIVVDCHIAEQGFACARACRTGAQGRVRPHAAARRPCQVHPLNVQRQVGCLAAERQPGEALDAAIEQRRVNAVARRVGCLRIGQFDEPEDIAGAAPQLLNAPQAGAEVKTTGG